MLKINLRNDWYVGPEYTLLRKSNNPHDIPDDWLVILPSTAVFADGENKGKTVGVVRNKDKPDAKPVVEPLPTLSPLPFKEQSTAVGGVDAGVLAGDKDTFSPPPGVTVSNRSPNPPILAEVKEQNEKIEQAPPAKPPAKPEVKK